MNKKNHIVPLATGILAGVMLTTTVGAAVDYVKARLSNQPIYLDGERIDCRTYSIAGQNYIRLVDLCNALGVDWYWDSTANSVYLGERSRPVAEGTVTLPTDGSKSQASSNKEGRTNRCAPLFGLVKPCVPFAAALWHPFPPGNGERRVAFVSRA